MASSLKLISVFRVIPKELFRVNNGRRISLREWTPKRTYTFDIFTENGKVKPKALDPETYEGPNGASMRPNTSLMRSVVNKFKGSDVVVFSVLAGTKLPDELVLVHEHTDHYSLQPAEEMSLNELNSKITAFLGMNGQLLSKKDWLGKYAEPTKTS